MSVYQFLKNFEDLHTDSESYQEFHSEESEQAVHKSHPLPLSTLFTFLAVPVIILLLRWCCRRKTVQPLVTFNFVVNLQNYFREPVIRNVNFYQGDQVVPSDQE